MVNKKRGITKSEGLKYSEWIREYVQKHKCVYGLCEHATYMCCKEFPELKRVRGFIYDLIDSRKYEHWWCVTRNGDIIDPTTTQFMGISKYEEWDETQQEPTGKCLNCGEYCYNNRETCCDACAIAFRASLR